MTKLLTIVEPWGDGPFYRVVVDEDKDAAVIRRLSRKCSERGLAVELRPLDSVETTERWLDQLPTLK